MYHTDFDDPDGGGGDEFGDPTWWQVSLSTYMIVALLYRPLSDPMYCFPSSAPLRLSPYVPFCVPSLHLDSSISYRAPKVCVQSVAVEG